MQEGPQNFNYGGRQFLRIPLKARAKEPISCTIPARVAGRYRVNGLLASGGGGAILEGYDERTNNDVILKTVLGYRLQPYADRLDTDGAVEHIRRLRHRLQTERRILVQLRRRGASGIPHPNDYVYDWNPSLAEPLPAINGRSWSLDDRELMVSEPFLVLERVEGASLQKLLAAKYPEGMPASRAMAVIDPVVAVFELLHQPFVIEEHTWQLVYQDVKPGNILVSGRSRATLVDFGGCQVVIEGMPVLDGFHTPGYCPPEQAAHSGQLMPAADVYGVGSTLYHMLTGVNPQKLLAKQAPAGAEPANGPTQKQPPARGQAVTEWDWEKLPARCPRRLRLLIQRCLASDPAERYQDGAALAAALRAIH